MSLGPYSIGDAVHGDVNTLELSRCRLQELIEVTQRFRPGAVEPALAVALGLYTTAIEVRTRWPAELADTWGRLVLGGMDHRAAMQVARDIHRPEES
jgi:hypothetical protein